MFPYKSCTKVEPGLTETFSTPPIRTAPRHGCRSPLLSFSFRWRNRRVQNYFQNATRKIMRTFPHADLDADFCMGVFAHADADFCIAMRNLLYFPIILHFAKFYGCEKLRLYVRTCGCGCRFLDKYVLTCRCGTPQSCACFRTCEICKKKSLIAVVRNHIVQSLKLVLTC